MAVDILKAQVAFNIQMIRYASYKSNPLAEHVLTYYLKVLTCLKIEKPLPQVSIYERCNV